MGHFPVRGASPGPSNGFLDIVSVQESVQLIEPRDALLILARHSLAPFADVNAMTTPAARSGVTVGRSANWRLSRASRDNRTFHIQDQI
jgi:hypothetical protein